MKTYFALTIGPIYDTISSSRTTREMWASSYLFSYIIKQLVEKFQQKGMDILLPSPDFIKHKNFQGAGIYPDRIIAKSICKQEEVQDIIDDTIKELSLSVYIHFNNRKNVIGHLFKENSVQISGLHDGIYEYLQKYLRIYYLCKEIDERNQNIINILYPLLDAMELQPRILPTEKFPDTTYKRLLSEAPSKARVQTSPLRLFTDLINGSFLIDDGLGTPDERKINHLNPKRHFSSLNEIATAELKQINKIYYEEFEQKIQCEISETWQAELERDRKIEKTGFVETESMAFLRKRFRNEYKTYHNYIAIVHGDGDNIGTIIKNMTKVKNAYGDEIRQEEALKAFSAMLTKYSIDATKIVTDYGASSVYIGGDDLFFFAPVASKNKITNKWECIFDLIKNLDILFNSRIRDQKDYDFGSPTDKLPSLSYGISITYRKFPLYEARNISYNLMKYIAKEDMKRNAIATTILKASGHDISFNISKKNPLVFQGFLDMIHSRIFSRDNFINSITYKLESLKGVLIPISNDYNRVKNFFMNNFNENYNANKEFYEALERFIILLSGQNHPDHILVPDDYKLLYGTLRFIHFLRSKEKE